MVIPYSYLALPPSHPLFPSAIETVKPEGPVPCFTVSGASLDWATATLRMPETHDDDICSSLLYLVSTSRTEIITVPADPVPTLESGRMRESFLMERLLLVFNTMGTADVQQYVNRMERIGGAPGLFGSVTVQYADDTVQIQDTAQTQDTDTDHTSQTLQTWDSDVAQAQDIQDTQDN